ncbi:MAG: hypothetical protein JOZ82_04200 [Marmoricola sp.]|nr:hypothetical protein [Marmoricola sp.]
MGRRLTAAGFALGCALALAGCGSAAPARHSQATHSQETQAGSCAGDPASFTGARTVGSVDLDGDGSPDPVRVTPTSQECAARVVARLAHGYAGADVQPGPVTVSGVALRGHHGALLVTRQDHPRGGYQVRVFAVGPDGLVELKDGDQPLVPFVATDTRPIPYTVDCRGGAIIVDQAVAKAGGRWDIERTTYAVHGTTATKAGSQVVARTLSPAQADTRMTVGGAVFPSCRA